MATETAPDIDQLASLLRKSGYTTAAVDRSVSPPRVTVVNYYGAVGHREPFGLTDMAMRLGCSVAEIPDTPGTFAVVRGVQ